MIYLLDTHVFLWAVFESNKLSKRVKEILSDTNNSILVSALSFWEISLKYSTGKIAFKNVTPEELIPIAKQLGFDVADLSPEQTATFYKLTDDHHRDPFDRMLVWIAKYDKYTLISNDKFVKKYSGENLNVVW